MQAFKDTVQSIRLFMPSDSQPLVKPQDLVQTAFEKQEELRCDPLYLAVIFGNISLLYQKFQQKTKELQHKNQSDQGQPKEEKPFCGIKISLKEDSQILIHPPNMAQGFVRWWNKEGRLELRLIRRHLIKFLRWFDYKEPNYHTILKVCQEGIEVILNSYKDYKSRKIKIYQKQEGSQEEDQTAIVIKTMDDQEDLDFVIRILQEDIALLKEALQSKDETREAQFTQMLMAEEASLFPLDQKLRLLGTAKTIDTYMKEQIIERWRNQIKIVAESFTETTKSPGGFDYYGSIEQLISPNPAAHQDLKLQVRKKIADTLSQCRFVIVSDVDDGKN